MADLLHVRLGDAAALELLHDCNCGMTSLPVFYFSTPITPDKRVTRFSLLLCVGLGLRAAAVIKHVSVSIQSDVGACGQQHTDLVQQQFTVIESDHPEFGQCL